MGKAAILTVFILATLLVEFSQGALTHRVKREDESSSAILEINTFIDYVGPRRKVDLIFVLDRSKGIGKERFYLEERTLAKQLIMRYCTLHEWYVQIAGRYILFSNTFFG